MELGHTDNQGRRLRSVTDARPPLCPLTRAGAVHSPPPGQASMARCCNRNRTRAASRSRGSSPAASAARWRLAAARRLSRLAISRGWVLAAKARSSTEVGQPGELAEEEPIVTGPIPGARRARPRLRPGSDTWQRGARPGCPGTLERCVQLLQTGGGAEVVADVAALIEKATRSSQLRPRTSGTVRTPAAASVR